MLLNRPLSHLQSSAGSENASGHGAGSQREGDPAEDLCRVVGARDVIEEEATWDDVLLGTCWAHGCQYPVAPAQPGEIIHSAAKESRGRGGHMLHDRNN